MKKSVFNNYDLVVMIFGYNPTYCKNISVSAGNILKTNKTNQKVLRSIICCNALVTSHYIIQSVQKLTVLI